MLPPRVLKMTAELLATPLTTIFNLAIEENSWPSAWKRGEWIPIYKKEDPLDKVNYTPVTVLTAVDKIFEQLKYANNQVKSLSQFSIPFCQLTANTSAAKRP